MTICAFYCMPWVRETIWPRVREREREEERETHAGGGGWGNNFSPHIIVFL